MARCQSKVYTHNYAFICGFYILQDEVYQKFTPCAVFMDLKLSHGD